MKLIEHLQLVFDNKTVSELQQVINRLTFAEYRKLEEAINSGNSKFLINLFEDQNKLEPTEISPAINKPRQPAKANSFHRADEKELRKIGKYVGKDLDPQEKINVAKLGVENPGFLSTFAELTAMALKDPVVKEANIDVARSNNAQASNNATKQSPTSTTTIPNAGNVKYDRSDIDELSQISKNLDKKLNPQEKQALATAIASSEKGKDKSTLDKVASTFDTVGTYKDLFKGSFKSGMAAGQSFMEDIDNEFSDIVFDDELINELLQLSSITNENTAGAVAIAPTASSIVGNTSNSHRPSVKLGAKVREKQYAKDRKKLNKYKKD